MGISKLCSYKLGYENPNIQNINLDIVFNPIRLNLAEFRFMHIISDIMPALVLDVQNYIRMQFVS
jgi:hypothetical protein